MQASQKDLAASRAYVRSVAMKYVRDEQDAEDVTQDAMLLAYRYRHAFRGESRYSTWLYRVTATAALMFLRRQRRLARELPSSTTTDEDGTPWLDRHAAPGDVRNQVIARADLGQFGLRSRRSARSTPRCSGSATARAAPRPKSRTSSASRSPPSRRGRFAAARPRSARSRASRRPEGRDVTRRRSAPRAARRRSRATAPTPGAERAPH